MPELPKSIRPRYRKVLYLQQDYPDNYVDYSFLQDLKRNVNLHPTPLLLLLRQTIPITQHLASTIIFISIFTRLLSSSLSPISLLLLSTSLYLSFSLHSHLSTSPTPSLPFLPLFTLYLLSPALKTLTRATTSDSIWALSGVLLSTNLLFADYSLPSPHLRPHVTLPLTAALSASTVLASRLDSNLAVFSLLLFSTLWFGPFPLLCSSLPLRPSIALTIALVGTALWSLGGGGAQKVAAACLFGTSVLAPVGRGWLGIKYKDRVRGPWDQARPKVGS